MSLPECRIAEVQIGLNLMVLAFPDDVWPNQTRRVGS
jgi:hypothetical protein